MKFVNDDCQIYLPKSIQMICIKAYMLERGLPNPENNMKLVSSNMEEPQPPKKKKVVMTFHEVPKPVEEPKQNYIPQPPIQEHQEHECHCGYEHHHNTEPNADLSHAIWFSDDAKGSQLYIGIMPDEYNQREWFDDWVDREGLLNLCLQYPYMPLTSKKGVLSLLNDDKDKMAMMTNALHVIAIYYYGIEFYEAFMKKYKIPEMNESAFTMDVKQMQQQREDNLKRYQQRAHELYNALHGIAESIKNRTMDPSQYNQAMYDLYNRFQDIEDDDCPEHFYQFRESIRNPNHLSKSDFLAYDLTQRLRQFVLSNANRQTAPQYFVNVQPPIQGQPIQLPEINPQFQEYYHQQIQKVNNMVNKITQSIPVSSNFDPDQEYQMNAFQQMSQMHQRQMNPFNPMGIVTGQVNDVRYHAQSRENQIFAQNIPGFVSCDEADSVRYRNSNMYMEFNQPQQQPQQNNQNQQPNPQMVQQQMMMQQQNQMASELVGKSMIAYVIAVCRANGIPNPTPQDIISMIEMMKAQYQMNMNTISPSSKYEPDMSLLVDTKSTGLDMDKINDEIFKNYREAFQAFPMDSEEPRVDINIKRLIRDANDTQPMYAIDSNNLVGEEQIVIDDKPMNYHPNLTQNGQYILRRDGTSLYDRPVGNNRLYDPFTYQTKPEYPVYGNNYSPVSMMGGLYQNNYSYQDIQNYVNSLPYSERVKIKNAQDNNMFLRKTHQDMSQRIPQTIREAAELTLPGQIQLGFGLDPNGPVNNITMINNNVPYNPNNPYNINPWQDIATTALYGTSPDIQMQPGQPIRYKGVPIYPDYNNPCSGIVTVDRYHPQMVYPKAWGPYPPYGYEPNQNLVYTPNKPNPLANPKYHLPYDFNNINLNPNINRQKRGGIPSYVSKSKQSLGEYRNAMVSSNPNIVHHFEDNFMVPTQFDIDNDILMETRLLIKGSPEYKRWEEDSKRVVSQSLCDDPQAAMKDAINNLHMRVGKTFIDNDTQEEVCLITYDYGKDTNDVGKYVVNNMTLTEEEYNTRKQSILKIRKQKKEEDEKIRKENLKHIEDLKHNPRWEDVMNQMRKEREEEALKTDCLDLGISDLDDLNDQDNLSILSAKARAIEKQIKKLEAQELKLSPMQKHQIMKFVGEYSKYNRYRAYQLKHLMDSDIDKDDFLIYFKYCVKHLRLLKEKESMYPNVDLQASYQHREIPQYHYDPEKRERVWDTCWMKDDLCEYHIIEGKRVYDIDHGDGFDNGTVQDMNGRPMDVVEAFSAWMFKAIDEREYIIKRGREKLKKEQYEREMFGGRTEEEILYAYNPYDPNCVKMYNFIQHQKKLRNDYTMYRRMFGTTMTDEEFDIWFYGPLPKKTKQKSLEDKIMERRRFLLDMTEYNQQFLMTGRPLDYNAGQRRFNELVQAANERTMGGIMDGVKSLKEYFQREPMLLARIREQETEEFRQEVQKQFYNYIPYDEYHQELAKWFNETKTGYDLKTSEMLFGKGGFVNPNGKNKYFDITHNNNLYEERKARFLNTCKNSRGTIPLSPLYK